MHKTVHVRTVFPAAATSGSRLPSSLLRQTSGGPAPHLGSHGRDFAQTAIYSESGRGHAGRSLFFVIRHPERAPQLARQLTELYQSDKWLTGDAFLAGVRHLVTLAEAQTGHPLHMSLALLDPPRFSFLGRGDGLFGWSDSEDLELSADVAGLDAALPCFPDAGGWCQWSTEPELGSRFVLGFRSDLNSMHPMELIDLTRLFERTSRPSAAGRAASSLSERGGALVVGRFHHLPWRAATATVDDVSAGPGGRLTRARAGTGAVLAAAMLIFAVLTRVGSGPAPLLVGEADAAATYSRPLPDAREWVTSLGASITDAPVAFGGLLLVPCGDGQLRLVDSVSGTLLDHVDLTSPISAPPAVAGSRLLLGLESGKVSSFDPNELKTEWTADLGIGDAVTSVVAEGDWAWATCGASVVALDLADGRERWGTRLAEHAITHLEVAEGVAVATSEGGDVVAFNPRTGQERWRQALGTALVGGPHVTEGRVAVVESWGRVVSYRLTRGNLEWSTHLSARPVDVICPDSGTLFVATEAPHSDGHPSITAINVRGQAIRWRRDLESTSDVRELRAHGSNILVFDVSRSVHAVSRESGETVFQRSLPINADRTTLLTAGRLVSATDDTLTAVTWFQNDSASDGSRQKRVGLGAGLEETDS